MRGDGPSCAPVGEDAALYATGRSPSRSVTGGSITTGYRAAFVASTAASGTRRREGAMEPGERKLYHLLVSGQQGELLVVHNKGTWEHCFWGT